MCLPGENTLRDFSTGPFSDMKQKLSDVNTQEFWNCIALCNDCISIRDGDKISYNGPSVDEVCLMDMARDAGISYFVDRDSSSVRIATDDGQLEFALIHTYQFTSDRKCMSVIVKNEKDGKTYSYVKGADSSVFPLCTATDKSQIKECERMVDEMSSKGLRTLCYGMKPFDLAGRDPLDIDVAEVESGLTLLACTAVEDLLQENVKECIIDFRAAGISVWMLTGDKGLTAKEIAVSCGMIPENSTTASATQTDGSDTNKGTPSSSKVAPLVQESGSLIFDFDEALLDPAAIQEKICEYIESSKTCAKYTVLISGITMQKVLDNKFTHTSAAELLLKAESVIMFRSSPSQKAEVVLFMKKATNGKVTLAIGDGANDVNMIQQAHIGFGLMGKEGNQAAAFSDYAIPRFKDLRRALFWHGRGYGQRMINLVCFCLFKSMINATTKYCMQWENGYSGQQPVEGLLLALYNVTMTVWFMFGMSYLDQDVSRRKYDHDESAMPYKMSECYIYSRNYQSRKRFYWTIVIKDAYSIFCGAAIYYIFYYGQGPMGYAGKMFGVWSYGVFSTLSCVLIHHVECAMYTRNWSPDMVGWFCLSLTLVPITFMGQNSIPKSELYKSIYEQVFRSARVDLMIICAVFLCSLPLYAFKVYHQVIRQPKFYTQD